MLEAYNYVCANKGCFNRVEHFHHIIPNTEVNNKLYPLYLQSPFNCYPICSTCHLNKPLPIKPPERLIILFEEWLSEVKSKESE
jgi:5-methylcytosine-specific restriction endonuclease McrA